MYSNCPPTKSKKEMNKDKFRDWFAGILATAVVGMFGFLLNANTYFHKVDVNTENIKGNTKEIKTIKEKQNENYIKILDAINKLSIEMKDKKNREE